MSQCFQFEPSRDHQLLVSLFKFHSRSLCQGTKRTRDSNLLFCRSHVAALKACRGDKASLWRARRSCFVNGFALNFNRPFPRRKLENEIERRGKVGRRKISQLSDLTLGWPDGNLIRSKVLGRILGIRNNSLSLKKDLSASPHPSHPSTLKSTTMKAFKVECSFISTIFISLSPPTLGICLSNTDSPTAWHTTCRCSCRCRWTARDSCALATASIRTRACAGGCWD